MRAFDLNIQEVLEAWTVAEAVRELIANALDEQRLTDTAEPVISREADGWHIRDFGRGLQTLHLTQNENEEKLAHPNLVIGKFGVGLKDAVAVLHRHGVDVGIRSAHNDLSFGVHGKAGFDLETLHAFVAPPSEPTMAGTDVVLSGPAVTSAVVESAKRLFLMYADLTELGSTGYGSVLARDGGPARIFINGLQVAEDDSLLFSYNITSLTAPLRKALNRERSNVGRAAYSDRVKAILLACTDEPVVSGLVEDLEGYQTGTWHDEVQWLDVGVHACQQLAARGSTIFLTPIDLLTAPDFVDAAQGDGHTVVVVPDAIAHRLRGTVDAAGIPIRDLEGYREEWNDSFTFDFVDPDDLADDERAVWERLEEILGLRGGRPRVVREVLISSTMRLADGEFREACGVWDPAAGRIVVKRDTLGSLERFAGTVLHEVAHAVSGAPDVSRRFEEALTDELGRLFVGGSAHPRGRQ
jgi:hypothetical protein